MYTLELILSGLASLILCISILRPFKKKTKKPSPPLIDWCPKTTLYLSDVLKNSDNIDQEKEKIYGELNNHIDDELSKIRNTLSISKRDLDSIKWDVPTTIEASQSCIMYKMQESIMKFEKAMNNLKTIKDDCLKSNQFQEDLSSAIEEDIKYSKTHQSNRQVVYSFIFFRSILNELNLNKLRDKFYSRLLESEKEIDKNLLKN